MTSKKMVRSYHCLNILETSDHAHIQSGSTGLSPQEVPENG